MNVIVLPQAADEFDDAVAHYNDKQAGLGQRFRDEVDRHIRWIVAHSNSPSLRSGGYRRVNRKVFPHYVAYIEIGQTLWILAIAHAHREPEYWIGRKQDIGLPGAPPSGGPASSPGSLGDLDRPPSVS